MPWAPVVMRISVNNPGVSRDYSLARTTTTHAQEVFMSRWIMTLTLSVFMASAALAGDVRARIEGPAADGVTYTARTVGLDENDTLEPWALAEGVVEGKHRSVLIRVEPTSDHGVYRLTRNWPAEGQWMIRYNLGHPPAPATVVTLGADGTVQSNKHYFKSDGSRECWKVLKKKAAKLDPKFDPNEEDC